MLLTWLRWFGVLPIAIVGGILAGWLVTLVNALTMDFSGFNSASLLGRLYKDAVGSGVLGAATIYFGAKVAPSHKTTTALALAGLVLVLSGFLLFPAVLQQDWWAVYGAVFIVVAAGAMAWSIYNGDLGEADFQ